MKKILVSFLMFSSLLSVPSVSAAGPFRNIKPKVLGIIHEARESGTSPGQIKKNIVQEVKDKLKNLRFGARFNGTLLAIDGNTLTVAANNGNTYTVFVSDKTQLRRRFWGQAQLAEFSVGDKLNVIGKWKDDAKTQVDAQIIRNSSIQKRFGVFFGNITSKSDSNFVMQTISRGTQTVFFDSSTKFVNRRGEGMSYADVQVGHRVRVKGLWDNKLNKIIEVTQVKDFSVPAQGVTPTPTP